MGVFRIYLFFMMIHLIYVVSAQEVVKRVPHGFVGMRGKKLIDSAEMEKFYKRKPQFFVGVKGKKNYLDALDDGPVNVFKRAPMGFVGMRGKKDLFSPEMLFYPENYEYIRNGGSLVGQIVYSTKEDIKNTDETDFPLLNEMLSEYLQKLQNSDFNTVESETASNLVNNEDQTNERITNEVDKRAANIHQFFGVRGKKSFQNKRPYDLTFRGKFIGVRGKKDVNNNNAQEIKFLLDHSGPWPKRKSQMGFFGMRGKKWTDGKSLLVGTTNYLGSF